jgi:hypothetical protein
VAILNRIIIVLLGLALAAAGVLLVAETIAAAVSAPPLLLDRSLIDSRLAEMSWTDVEVDVTIAILIGLGALLLLAQLIPRQPDALPLRAGQGREAEVDRKALAGLIAARAGADRDVLSARAEVTRRAAKVDARALPGADVGSARARLGQMLSEALGAIDLARPLRQKVTVRRSRERSA